MLWILRYILGYLKIEISGEYAEIIINLASKEKIRLWNLRYRKQKIVGCVTVRDYKKMRILRRKTGIKIKITQKKGLPFILHRYRKRSGIAVGAIIFFCVLEIMSSFIWTVTVSGNKITSDREILDVCNKIGIYEGTAIKKIDTKNMADELLLGCNNLAWASLNIEGCVLTVNVTEVKNQKDKENNTPSNLIATEDGIINKINATSGNVLVKVGDAVAKGDILVSGISENLKSTVFVQSKGIITAEIQKDFYAEENFIQEQYFKTEKIIKRNVLSIFSLKIPLYLGKIKESYQTEDKIKELKIFDKRLPIRIYEKTFFITEKRKVIYNAEELKEKLEFEIESQIKKYNAENVKIRSESLTKNEKGATLKKTVLLTTDIAKEKAIIIKENQ